MSGKGMNLYALKYTESPLNIHIRFNVQVFSDEDEWEGSEKKTLEDIHP